MNPSKRADRLPFSVILLGFSLMFLQSGCPDPYEDDDASASRTPVDQSAPQITISPESLDFGDVLVNTTRSLRLTISNTGDADLFIGEIYIDDNGTGSFGWSEQPVPFTLEPSDSVTVQVTFTPRADHSFWGDFVIKNNDEDNAVAKVGLKGNGTRGTDDDGDDVTVEEDDCDDGDPDVYPGADEVCDGKDNDCDDEVDEGFDLDEDGYSTCEALDEVIDCDDADDTVYPGAPELCDGKDNDCDNEVDEGFDADDDGTSDCIDDDHDGYTETQGDCDDGNPAVNPGALEVCDGIDNDCNDGVDEGFDLDGDGTADCIDDDLDGYSEDGTVGGASDCDDTDPEIYPGAPERCNHLDDDCNGLVDDGPLIDQDNDGVAECDGDCDDSNPDVHPGATETCNGVDDNCDGHYDEGLPSSTYYADADGDGYGDPGADVSACLAPQGYVTDSTDCDDTVSSVHPGADEVCNGIDDDCDAGQQGGGIDEGVKNTYYADEDGDGYGGSSNTSQACSPPSGYVEGSTDCNDANASIHPEATELCNGTDDDCDGAVDEGIDTSLYYLDSDGDGYGDPNQAVDVCSRPEGYVTRGTDCDDARSSVHPEATETCNERDDDCDGTVDEGVTHDYYPDADSDGYGAEGSSAVAACSAPQGHVDNATDCNDAVASVYPGAPEQCNDVDDDCDDEVDEGIAYTDYYRDRDADGYGKTSDLVSECQQPQGYVLASGDCNDNDAAIHPNATEVCNGVDDDCDGKIDENVKTKYYVDADGDSYGASGSQATSACSPPDGYVANATDCDDTLPLVNPAGLEVCNEIDDNCNGEVDEGFGDCNDVDDDGDTFTENEGDCDDWDASIYPILVDVDYNGGSEDGSVSHPFNTIQEGINAAREDCPVVLVEPGTYHERIDFQAKEITVRSRNGASETTIDGDAGGSVVTAKNGETSATILQGFTVTDGSADRGAGIYISDASPTILNNTFTANTSTVGGGGAYVRDSQATFNGNTFTDNIGATVADGSLGGGAVLLYRAAATVTNNIFRSNSHISGGAIGLFNDSDALISNNIFEGNEAKYSSSSATGGAIYVYASSPEIQENEFLFNNSLAVGGAIYLNGVGSSGCVEPTATSVLIDGNTFTENTAGETSSNGKGGAIYANCAAPELVRNTFDGNRAGLYGGAAYFRYYSEIVVTSNVFDGSSVANANDSGAGGALYLATVTGTIDDNKIRNSVSGYNGGAILLTEDVDIVFSNNDVVDNNAQSKGGGMYVNHSVADIYGNLFEGNSASAGGGLVLVDTPSTVRQNVFQDNSAAERAGGILLYNQDSDSEPVVTNNIVRDNRVNVGRGGGICINDEGTVQARGQVINNVVAGNSASDRGAGIYIGQNAPAVVKNNIVWYSVLSHGIYASTTTAAELVVMYNDSSMNPFNYGGALADNRDSSNLTVDPQFQAYTNDGDPSNDNFHLKSSSPVINKGDPATAYNDLDGSRNDMGAYGGQEGSW